MGKHKKAEVDSETKTFTELIGGKNDTDSSKNSYVKCIRFPGRRTCNLCGKEVPCMVLWSENASITCDIMTDIFHTLDLYELFMR